MGNILKIKMLKGESWYGGNVVRGSAMPITKWNIFINNNTINNSTNQSNPIYLSNKGRYIWCNDGFSFSASLGRITCVSKSEDIILKDGFGDLKGAFLQASKNHFPSSGNMPNELMFKNPQYCTWIELLTNQREELIIKYAEEILENGMPNGELLIDDGWQTDFGDWSFDKEKIKSPKEMIKKLTSMGFKVILWICPFVSPKCKNYDYLVNNDCLVKDKDGSIAMRKWWNGVSAVLDLSNPRAVDWFEGVADGLMNNFGIAGFKQDAGDAFYYKESDKTFGGVTPNKQSELWHNTAMKYEFNELRACFKGGGSGVAQRLEDKGHNWNAVKTLVPHSLLQGITGYQFTCPDMIGGGQAGDFKNKENGNFNAENFTRSAQASAMMPMMQYSFAVWNLQDKKAANWAIDACKIHTKYSDYIVALAKESAKTGEPMVRYLEYEFPNQGFEKSTDKFMLGNRYLIYPITKANVREITLRLPKGKWEYIDGKIYEGKVKLEVDLSTLPIFKKL